MKIKLPRLSCYAMIKITDIDIEDEPVHLSKTKPIRRNEYVDCSRR